MPRACPSRPSPPRFRTCPAPTPRFPDAHPRLPLAPARGARAAGPRVAPSPFSLGSSQPRPRHPHPACLSHPRRALFPTSQPTPAPTWFKSSHKTLSASPARPLGAAAAADWLIPRS